jgi:hypothetical protein
LEHPGVAQDAMAVGLDQMLEPVTVSTPPRN